MKQPVTPKSKISLTRMEELQSSTVSPPGAALAKLLPPMSNKKMLIPEFPWSLSMLTKPLNYLASIKWPPCLPSWWFQENGITKSRKKSEEERPTLTTSLLRQQNIKNDSVLHKISSYIMISELSINVWGKKIFPSKNI